VPDPLQCAHGVLRARGQSFATGAHGETPSLASEIMSRTRTQSVVDLMFEPADEPLHSPESTSDLTASPSEKALGCSDSLETTENQVQPEHASEPSPGSDSEDLTTQKKATAEVWRHLATDKVNPRRDADGEADCELLFFGGGGVDPDCHIGASLPKNALAPWSAEDGVEWDDDPALLDDTGDEPGSDAKPPGAGLLFLGGDAAIAAMERVLLAPSGLRLR